VRNPAQDVDDRAATEQHHLQYGAMKSLRIKTNLCPQLEQSY
jgi:hypothetical protein